MLGLTLDYDQPELPLQVNEIAEYNRQRQAEIDERLQQIMRDIHTKCVRYGKQGATIDYVTGANVAGFARVADAIVSQGLI